jgi:hypothetical protein
VTLTAADIDAIADALVEKLAEREPAVVRYVDVRAAARRLSMSEQWVREHAAEFGGSRLGAGERGELRFDVRELDRAMAARRLEQTHPRRRRKPGPRPGTSHLELLTSRRSSVMAHGGADGG